MQVDIKDTIMDIMRIKSTKLEDYFTKYKIERKFLNSIEDSDIDTINDSVIYRCEGISLDSKDYISIKLNLLKVLLGNMDRTEKMWNIYIHNIDKKNLELKDMIRDIISEVKESKLGHNTVLNMNESLENLNVDTLRLLGIPNDYMKYAENNKIITFKDLKSDINFIENYNTEYVNKLFKLDLEEFIREVIKRDVRSYEMLTMYDTGMTLEAIGDNFGLTKERVRQILAKLRYQITSLLADGMADKKIVDLDNFGVIIRSNILDSDKTGLLNYFIQDDYLMDRFLKLEERILARLENDIWLDSLKEGFKEDIDCLDLSSFISVDIIFNKIKNNKKFKTSNYAIVSMESISGSIANIRVEVIKHFYPNGIYISQDNIDKIVDITNEITGKNKENSSYFLKNSIVKVCVLKDRNTYIHPDLVDVSADIINKIKEYALNRPGVELFYGTVFRVFEEELKENGIDNEYYLHGIMSKYLSDILEIKARSYYVKGHKTKKILELVEEISYNEKRIVSLNELEKYIDKDCYRSLLNKASSLDYILTYSNTQFYSCRNLEISSEDIKNIRDNIDKIIIYNRLDCDVLYDSMLKNNDSKNIIEKNKIINGRALKSIIRRLFTNDFDGVPANDTLVRVKE